MKTLYRVLVILVVAALVGGAMFAAVNGGSASSSGQLTVLEGQRPFSPDGDGFRPEGGERDFDEGGFMLPFGMVKALAIISIVAVIYFSAGKRSRKKVPAV